MIFSGKHIQWPQSGRILVQGLLLLSLFSSAFDTKAFHITQIQDERTDLQVFVSDEALAGASAKVEVALGADRLPVRQVKPIREFGSALALVVAVDISASLNQATFKEMQQAVKGLITRLPKGSQVALVTIGTEYRLIEEFSADLGKIGSRIDALAASDAQTALYESILKAQQFASTTTSNLPRRRALLVVSDGLDDSPGGYSQDELRRRVGIVHVPIFAVGIQTLFDHSTKHDSALKTLGEIARATGGEYFQTKKEDLGGVAVRMDKTLNAGAVISLDCNLCPRDGVSRRIQVSSTTAGTTVSDSRDLRLLSASLRPEEGKKNDEAAVTEGMFARMRSYGDDTYKEYPVPVVIFLTSLALLLLASLWKGARWARQRRMAAKAIQDEALHWQEPLVLPDDYGDQSPPGKSPESMASSSMTQSRTGRRIVISVRGKGNCSYFLDTSISIGRSKNNAIVLEEDSQASANHAEIRERNGVILIVDKGATNGTFLNGTRIVGPEPLSDGDVIVAGRTELRIHFAD